MLAPLGDDPALTTSAVRALLALPGAVVSLQTLLGRRGRAAEVQAKFREIEVHLSNLADLGKLAEVVRDYQQLLVVNQALQAMGRELEGVDTDRVRIARARAAWNQVARRPLQVLAGSAMGGRRTWTRWRYPLDQAQQALNAALFSTKGADLMRTSQAFYALQDKVDNALGSLGALIAREVESLSRGLSCVGQGGQP